VLNNNRINFYRGYFFLDTLYISNRDRSNRSVFLQKHMNRSFETGLERRIRKNALSDAFVYISHSYPLVYCSQLFLAYCNKWSKCFGNNCQNICTSYSSGTAWHNYMEAPCLNGCVKIPNFAQQLYIHWACTVPDLKINNVTILVRSFPI
jgi:hypothetical protein